MLAHTRNLWPDVHAAHRAGQRAAAVRKGRMHYVAGGVLKRRSTKVRSCQVLNAYKKAFREEMQRQFDQQAYLPKAGSTTETLQKFFFEPLDVSGMSQADFVAWQVKKAWGLL